MRRRNGDYPYGTTRKGTDLERTARVGSYTANNFGLFDMHGNVWEWCQDKYEKDYYNKSPLLDPPGPETGDSRVLRGGAWFYEAESCRSARRNGYDPSYNLCYFFGFRVVCELE